MKKEIITEAYLIERLKKKITRDELNLLLQKAVRTNNITCAKILIKNGADVRCENDICLCVAAYLGYKKMVGLLLDEKANPDAEDGYPIQVASQKGYTEIVKMLIEKGAKVDTFHNYAIKQAHENQYYDIVCLLEQHGAKLD